MELILANVRTPEERAGDLWAQLAANQRGVDRLREFAGKYGVAELEAIMQALLTYTERMTRKLLLNIQMGLQVTDYLDDDGVCDTRFQSLCRSQSMMTMPLLTLPVLRLSNR